MASIEEVRAQIMAAAQTMNEAGQAARQASASADTAVAQARMAFEGTGRSELLDAAAQAEAAAITITDAMVELIQGSQRLADVAGTL